MAKRPARSKSGYTFADLVADYEREAPRARSLHSYDRVFLLKALGRRRLLDLREEHFTDYGVARRASGEQAEIVNHELHTLTEILIWARDVAKKIEAFPKIQSMRVPPQPPSHIELRPSLSMLYGSGRGLLVERAPEIPTPKAARRTKPERWSDADVGEHIKQHPLDKRNRDGSRFSDQQRADAIEREQGIKIDRTTVSRHLRPYRRPSA